MSYAPDNEQIEDVKERLIKDLKEFRDKSENIIMNVDSYVSSYRDDLRKISMQMFDLQIQLNEIL